MTELMPYISYSRLATYRSCARKFYYRYVREIERDRPPAPYLTAGGALHAGIAEWWRTRSKGAALGALRSEWKSREGPTLALARPGAASTRFDYLDLAHCERVLKRYFGASHLSGYSLSSAMPSEWSGVSEIEASEGAGLSEAAVMAQLDPALPPVSFRIDAILQDASGRLHLVDRKCTTGWLSEDSIRRKIGVGHQLRLYQALAEKLLGVRIHATWVEGIYMGEDPKSGWNRVKSVPVGMFGPWQWTEEEVEETLEWAKATLADIESAEERTGGEAAGWAQNDRAGCPYCEFFALCEVPPSSRKAAIERDYRRKESAAEEEADDE